MLKKIIDNFKKGIENIKWISTLFSERLKIEITVIRLLYQSNDMKKRKEGLLNAIGQRVIELNEHPDRNILKDKFVADSMNEIENIEKNINELEQMITEISRGTA